ncbi:nucleoprotein [Hymenopteran arli-related virus OKIAV99]|uniref:Nucleoprotein n=1 Tax=Hymenopteran arli-related virus OKIAV99 TaxID=2792566 RepID=A0AAE7TQ54_9MONO|nr:nucleoprotein [Hymenopteran arli-related virus OKIAV99]QPL15341.1 nucleoprotein [Hymenopteran arli-related virus OKIAV99]
MFSRLSRDVPLMTSATAVQVHGPPRFPSASQGATFNPKRERFLSALPSAADEFLRSKNRMTVRDATFTKANSKTRANTTNIIPSRHEKEKIVVNVVAGGHPITQEIEANLAVVNLAVFYKSWYDQPKPTQPIHHLVGAYISILAQHCSIESLNECGIVQLWEKTDFEIVYRSFTLEQLKEGAQILMPPLFARMALSGDIISNWKSLMTMSFVLLVLIGKHLSEDSLAKWFTARLNTIGALLSGEDVGNKISPPALAMCINFYRFCAANLAGRRALFRVIKGLARYPSWRYQNVFSAILRLLEWTEMSHVTIIDTYLVRQYPALLALSELSGDERSALLDLYDFLASLPEIDQPFVRFEYSPDECDVTHSRHFKYFTAAGRAIASIDTPSMLNLKSRDGPNMISFCNSVKSQVLQIRAMNPATVAEAQSAAMGEKASRLYWEASREIYQPSVMVPGTQAGIPPFEPPPAPQL